MKLRLLYGFLFFIITSTFLFPQTLKITSPITGDKNIYWIVGEEYEILWKAENVNGMMRIETRDGLDSNWELYRDITVGEGKETYYVSKIEDDYLSIRISSLEIPALSHETRIKITDCAGVPGGNATVDNCGTCDNYPSNDCVKDCGGDWGGNLKEDACGVCGGDGSTCAKNTGYLTVTYTPREAYLYIDDIYNGQKSGHPVKLTFGKHTIRIQWDGYKEFSKTLTINGNISYGPVELEYTGYKKETKKEVGNLNISYYPKDALLYIDNVRIYSYGNQYTGIYKGTYAVGDHKITIRGDGLKTRTEWIRIDKGLTTFKVIYLDKRQKRSTNKSTYSSKYSATSSLYQKWYTYLNVYNSSNSDSEYFVRYTEFGFAYAPIEIHYDRPFGIYPFHSHHNYIKFSYQETKNKWLLFGDSWNVLNNYFSARYKQVTSNKFNLTGWIELRDGEMNINTIGLGKYFNNSLLHLTLYDTWINDIKYSALYEYYFNDYNIFSLEYSKMESGKERYDLLYKFLYSPSYSASKSWLISFYYKNTPTFVNYNETWFSNDFDLDIDYFFNKRFSVGAGYHYESLEYNDVIMEYWGYYSINTSFVSKEFQNGNRFQITYDYEPWRDDYKTYNVNFIYIYD